MKNKREIILDFTPLLDVIMIILFSFIICFQTSVLSKIKEAENDLAEANEKLAKAQELSDAAEEAMKEANDKAAVAEGIILNDTSGMINAIRVKIFLEGSESNWNMTIKYAVDKDGIIEYLDLGIIEDVYFQKESNTSPEQKNERIRRMAEKFDSMMSGIGYSSEEDALLCEIIYHSTDAGSHVSKESAVKMLRFLKNQFHYKYLFDSVFDLESED